MREKNQYFAIISKSHKLIWGKLYNFILLELEMTDLWQVAGKQSLKYASPRDDLNEPYKVSLMYFVTKD